MVNRHHYEFEPPGYIEETKIPEEDEEEEEGVPQAEFLTSGLVWTKDLILPTPMKVENGGTKVKEKYVARFTTPLSSLLSFLPLIIWWKMTYESNMCAEKVMADSGKCEIVVMHRNDP